MERNLLEWIEDVNLNKKLIMKDNFVDVSLS